MATHHVSLRRACPAPLGQLTPSPGECDLNEPDSSAAHLVHDALLLLPMATTYHGTRKQYWIWHGARCPTDLFLHTAEKPAGRAGCLWPMQATRLSSPCLKAGDPGWKVR